MFVVVVFVMTSAFVVVVVVFVGVVSACWFEVLNFEWLDAEVRFQREDFDTKNRKRKWNKNFKMYKYFEGENLLKK